jgi:hypothetical protein
MNVPVQYLTKSRFLHGTQCSKLLWTSWNAAHLLPTPDQQTLAILEEGKKVGALARQMFPDGVEISASSFNEAVMNSTLAIQERRPVFEATFVYNDCAIRADVLTPNEDGSWNLIEVKSTTAVEEIHLQDVAFQRHVLTGAGLRINRCLVAHINSAFVKHGPVDPHLFFTLADVTERVLALRDRIEASADEMLRLVRLTKAPAVQIGRWCNQPHGCPLHDTCWRHLPEQNVTELYRGGDKSFRLLARGVTRIADIPADVELTDRQAIQHRIAKTGRAHVDRGAIQAFLRQLKYPLSSLDFESWNSAIPTLDGTRPYAQVCFEYSLHILRSPGASPEHYVHLAESVDDPRQAFMDSLHGVLPSEGSVIGFNIVFELARLRECSEFLPGFRSWVDDIQRRSVDLLAVFRSFAFYHAGQRGSCSLKAILGPLTGQTYDDLDVRNGTTASAEFLRVMCGEVDEADRRRVRRALEEYCSRDTESLLWIISALQKRVVE